MSVDEKLERQQKIIVALFLLLGKALPKLSMTENLEMSVSESEIRRAWEKQMSPVRLISKVETPRQIISAFYGQIEGDMWM